MTLPADGILVVEDDEDLREELLCVLADHGLIAVAAGNGRQALELMSAWKPAVVLADLMMPVMNGWALADALANDHRLAGVPVLFMTAGRSFNHQRLGRPIFVKPLNLPSLVRALRWHVR